jgi:hypothetical protein
MRSGSIRLGQASSAARRLGTRRNFAGSDDTRSYDLAGVGGAQIAYWYVKVGYDLPVDWVAVLFITLFGWLAAQLGEYFGP